MLHTDYEWKHIPARKPRAAVNIDRLSLKLSETCHTWDFPSRPTSALFLAVRSSDSDVQLHNIISFFPMTLSQSDVTWLPQRLFGFTLTLDKHFHNKHLFWIWPPKWSLSRPERKKYLTACCITFCKWLGGPIFMFISQVLRWEEQCSKRRRQRP